MSTDARVQKAAIWTGLFGWTVLFIGMAVVGRLIPPPDPSDTAVQVAALYRDHHDRIRFGSVLMFSGAGFALFYVAAVSQQLKRMPGAAASLLAQAQLVGGAIGSFMLLWGPAIWVAASLRPEERSPETLQTLHDLAWVAFVAGSTWFVVQMLAVGVAVLTDAGERPVYPRWLGYLSVWAAVLLIPAPLDICFTTGPFAWDGLFVFWIPLAAFGAWFVPVVGLTLKAIDTADRFEGALA
jgi:hypothetical protein